MILNHGFDRRDSNSKFNIITESNHEYINIYPDHVKLFRLFINEWKGSKFTYHAPPPLLYKATRFEWLGSN